MKKRGISHVDWVMSMGIFIVYVVALFVFLRPGVSVEHKPQALLNLLEENVKDEIYINLKETPLYVSKCVAASPTEKSTITVQSNNWKFISFLPEEGGVKTGGSSITLSCSEDYKIESGKLFTLSYVPDNKNTGSPDLQLQLSSENVFAKLRATENKYYVYKNWMDSLGDEIYTDLKERFGFPKDFAIYFLEENENIADEQPAVAPLGMKKPEQENVYVVEWKDVYIDDDYVKTPVRIHIEVW